MLTNYVWNENSIYDILTATVDTDLLKGVADSMLEFKDTSTIVLYTSLNKTNTKLLEEGKYTSTIIAFEYAEQALGIKQSEYVIKISYNTNGLYDTLHPRAYTEIENIIKQNGLQKSEVTDNQIISYLLRNHTGIRVHSIDISKKCYTNTHEIFKNSNLAYFINPSAVKILEIKPKNNN